MSAGYQIHPDEPVDTISVELFTQSTPGYFPLGVVHRMLGVGCSISLCAQIPDDHKCEVGLRFSGINFSRFNSFSAIYKKRLNNGKFRRISGTFGSLNYSKNSDKSTFGSNAGLYI